MRLAHTPHTNGRATVIDTDTDKPVGYSEREPFPLGGYIFTVSDLKWKRIYKGNSMSTALAELEQHLTKQA
jgi:hypothetical protein